MDLKKYLQNVPILISIFSSLAFVLSVVYDWGYFMFLNISFSELPTSLSDHVKSALIWLPKTVLGGFVALTIELLTQRIERGMTEEEIILSSPNPKFTYYFRRSPFYFIIIVSTLAIILKILGLPVPLDALIFFTICLWVLINSWIFNFPRLQQKYSFLFRYTFKWLPIIVLIIWYLGYSEASSDIKINKTICILLNKNEKIESAILLRSFDKFILIWYKEKNTYEFIPWQSIYRFLPSCTTTNNNK